MAENEMKLTFLGTSAGTPSRTRNVTSMALTHHDGSTWIIDCGEGTQHQILKTFIKPSKISRIFITHFHGDHWFGIFGLLASLKIHGRKEDITIVSPVGLRKAIETIHSVSGSKLPFAIHFIEIDRYQKFYIEEDFQIEAVPILHSKPCFGYVFTTPERAGHFDIEKARLHGLDQVEDVRALASGRDVTKEGKLYLAENYRGPREPGMKIILLGDTYDASELRKYVANPDWLVHECTYDSSMQEKALEFGHSTASMAGQMAKDLNAKNLILTHFSPRYHEGSQIQIENLTAEARKLAEKTNVHAASDLMTINLG